MNTTLNPIPTRLAAFACALFVTIAMLGSVDGLATDSAASALLAQQSTAVAAQV